MIGWMSAPLPLAVCVPNQNAANRQAASSKQQATSEAKSVKRENKVCERAVGGCTRSSCAAMRRIPGNTRAAFNQPSIASFYRKVKGEYHLDCRFCSSAVSRVHWHWRKGGIEWGCTVVSTAEAMLARQCWPGRRSEAKDTTHEPFLARPLLLPSS